MRTYDEKVEVWGGLECTINRIADSYLDQLEYSGHYKREKDLELLAGLGITKLRYPVLWEKHQPNANQQIDWSLSESRLAKLRQLGIEPIAGLVHHGSGPAHVHILEESFASGLAQYAAEVAAKFPWINYYTPINEPLTTARFCGLYGFWFPHKRSDKTFVRILYNECKATVLAMQEIRKINPAAKLVQTEDLGKTHSTPLLKYQADFENRRRWLGFDLLCGKVTPKHKLWKYLLKSGLKPAELDFFIQNPYPPDVLGFNHYLTSERYLDHNIRNYPAHTHGGNKKQRYADVEVVRVGTAHADGPYKLLKSAWKRFKLPIAITELHLHCTRDEQLRWVQTVWHAANELKNEGVDIRAVTAWAAFGSYGWNKLLTRPNGDYESGIFDVLSGTPRTTALAQLVRGLSQGEEFHHPVMEGEGWWKRDDRIIYYPETKKNNIFPIRSAAAPLLILGKTGTLGNAFARICRLRNIKHQLLGREDLDVSDPSSIEKAISELKPWAIINATGYVRVDDAEDDCDTCFLVNSTGPQNLASACAQYKVKLVTFSSDLVFDGRKDQPYFEHDEVSPINIYGHSKAWAEQLVLQVNPDALVIRTSAFFGPWDQYNFVFHVRNSLKNNLQFNAAKDLFISPTYVPDLVNTSLDLLIDEEKGIWHLANNCNLSWADLAYRIAERSGYDSHLIVPSHQTNLGFRAQRPRNSVLKSVHGNMLPTLDNALERYFEHAINIEAVGNQYVS
ncbi:MAG: sugar nucleotide-binding protein [Sphingobacteriaceae bacterium]|nr:sugar nucleotide-binding protein [Sphingobacteriaceae bacterium]